MFWTIIRVANETKKKDKEIVELKGNLIQQGKFFETQLNENAYESDATAKFLADSLL